MAISDCYYDSRTHSVLSYREELARQQLVTARIREIEARTDIRASKASDCTGEPSKTSYKKEDEVLLLCSS